MIYKHNVSVFQNTKGVLVVKRDDEGKFNHDNVEELYKTMKELAKKHKIEMKVYKPQASGDTPLLFSDRYGNPYIALLPAKEAPSKVKVQKLA
jgi:CRISPR/Cas system CMR-associated protein Cmr1 (group 7 of RAMP superfamily)